MITETTVKNTIPLAEKIEDADRLIEQLKQQIKEQQQKKRELKRQQRSIEKLINLAASLEVDWTEEAIDYVWESLTAVLPLRSKSEEVEEKEEELIKNPEKKNTSNSFFAWQPTSNPAIATYFNIKTGRTQAAYFAANNKQRLAEIETKLMRWFPGVSCSQRMAQRLTQYKYELKVVGWDRVPLFDDSDFGWLTQMYDSIKPLSNNFKDYLCCRIEDNPALEIEF